MQAHTLSKPTLESESPLARSLHPLDNLCRLVRSLYRGVHVKGKSPLQARHGNLHAICPIKLHGGMLVSMNSFHVVIEGLQGIHLSFQSRQTGLSPPRPGACLSPPCPGPRQWRQRQLRALRLLQCCSTHHRQHPGIFGASCECGSTSTSANPSLLVRRTAMDF